MNKQTATQLIGDTFNFPFDEGHFRNFGINLLNNVDALLYQKIDDLVEAATRKGDHHIDTPCMACLDGNYVVNDIDEAKIAEMETMRVNDQNGN